MHRRVVLASSSRYRASMLAEAGIEVEVDPPELDERVWDDQLDRLGADGLALELARRKAAVVMPRHPGAIVIAGDQVGIVGVGDQVAMLTKQPDARAAVDQLLTMSGTTHELVNGLVLVDGATGRRAEGIDRQLVTMRRFSADDARQYVERFEPYDSSGSYRLEDQDRMAPLEPFVTDVRGEHDSGVLGLPLPLLGRLLHELTELEGE
jgi:septum formation protein